MHISSSLFPRADGIGWAGVQATIVANNNYESEEDVTSWGKHREIEGRYAKCWQGSL